MVKIGLERIREHSELFRNSRIGIIMNQASLDDSFRSTFEVFREAGLKVTALFGPQHGLFGHTQDNMIEWRGDEYSVAKVKIYSLYGENRKPTGEMLEDVDILVFDVPDVGTRYYTFIWTMALAMEAAAEHGKKFVVLDRPNPLGGLAVEGMMPRPSYASFVGLYPLPVRHGLTIGETALYLRNEFLPEVILEIIPMENWERKYYFEDTGREWIMPSPNMPAPDTALVYPGQCLLEATNISEGRGTTRPFEIFGAPWIEHEEMCAFLNESCPGAFFQPWYFEPVFHKYAGELCKGAFIHVTDRGIFHPLATTMTILSYLTSRHRDHFRWKEPPYEYEYKKKPVDILLGSAHWREKIESGTRPAEEWGDMWRESEKMWKIVRESALIY
jgi:uncharacterized protein YbbC (DUF1343 family)